MNKEYIINRLSQSATKKDENFVVNAIWNRIDNLNLKIITQQYIYCKSIQKYYIIDLYFPQIDFGVEVHEKYHDSDYMKVIDDVRFDHIISALKVENINYAKRIVKTYNNNMEDIINQINEIVKEILKIVELTPNLRWLSFDEELELIKKKGEISILDAITFNNINHVKNKLFNYSTGSGKGILKSWYYFKHNKNLLMWFPSKCSDSREETLKKMKGFANILTHDSNEIHEVNINSNLKWFLRHENDKTKRVVFMKYKNSFGESGYRFFGVFRAMGFIDIDINNKKVKARRFIKELNEFTLPK